MSNCILEAGKITGPDKSPQSVIVRRSANQSKLKKKEEKKRIHAILLMNYE